MTRENEHYQPSGIRFYDNASKREMMLVYPDEPQESLRGWILFRHPDGQWVTLRKATDADRKAINAAVVEAHHV